VDELIVKRLLKAQNPDQILKIIENFENTEFHIIIIELVRRFSILKMHNIEIDNEGRQQALISRKYEIGELEGKYPEDIMSDTRENMGYEPDIETADDEIMSCSKTEILDKVATWNGLIGYGNTIKSWVEDIWNIELDSLDE